MRDRNSKIRLWYGVYLSLFTVILGVLFIVSAAQIYYSDPAGDPYTRELAGEKLLVLLAPIILYILSVIAGYVLFLLFPAADRRIKPSRRDALKKLRPRVREGDGEEFGLYRKKLNTLETVRFIVWTVCAVFAVLSAVMSLVYLCNTANFPAEDITPEILRMLRHVLPWVGAAFALFLLAEGYDMISSKYELNCVKRLIVLGKSVSAPAVSPVTAEESAPSHEGPAGKANGVIFPKWVLLGIRLVIFALAVSFIVWGIVNGGMNDVFVKAINICTECIGLG